MDLHPLDIVLHIINIVVLYLLLRVILFQPVSRFMQGRSDKIRQQLDEAEAAKAAAEAMKENYDGQLARAQSDADALLRDGSKKAYEASDAILAQAKSRAEELVAEGAARAQEERIKAAASLEEEVTETALKLAGAILGREVRAEDNEKVIANFFTKAG